jgi:lipopolysaccharide transport system ATP-binding protein
MPDAIRLEHLSKRFRLPAGGQARYRTLRDELGRLGRAGFGWLRRGPAAGDELWALRDVSAEVPVGEVLGIIGRNGAGKSTLLKILSRITRPTRGRALILGRVGSLLEVGTGFHPELTGRENIFLNGAILGMGRAEIRRKFDEIVAFAETERFLDVPVKHYSTGMHMRLAFAVAAHLDPEILLVDEVLAVGDALFQKKCLGKMQSVASGGRTVVFVSHNMSAVQSLSDRVLWLEAGQVHRLGEPTGVVQSYLCEGQAAANERSWDDPALAPGSDAVRLRRVSVRPTGGEPAQPLTIRMPLSLEFDYWNFAAGARLNLSVVLTNIEGVSVFNTFPVHEPHWHGRPHPAGLFRSVCEIPGDLLNDGWYFVELFIVRDESHVLSRHEAILSFELLDSAERRTAWHGKWVGVVRPDLAWTTELIESGLPEPGDVRAAMLSPTAPGPLP